jgi:hypothetical protein
MKYVDEFLKFKGTSKIVAVMNYQTLENFDRNEPLGTPGIPWERWKSKI